MPRQTHITHKNKQTGTSKHALDCLDLVLEAQQPEIQPNFPSFLHLCAPLLPLCTTTGLFALLPLIPL